MADALTAPFIVAAAILCVAGAAKLRAPTGAARALAVLGVAPRRPTLRRLAARLLGVAELLLGAWCALAPDRLAAGLLAAFYAAFAGCALVLARRSSTCGCFSDSEEPATVSHSILSAALTLVAVGSTISSVHGLQGVFGRSPGYVAVFVLGTAGSAFGAVLAYTEVPRAWGSWTAR